VTFKFVLSLLPGIGRLIKDPMVLIVQNSIDKITQDLDIIGLMENL